MPTIGVLGAFDTKGAEFAYLIERIRARGHRVITIDTSVLNEPAISPDVPASRVAEAGGATLEELRGLGSRGPAMHAMAQGAGLVVIDLYNAGRIDGIVGMGGSGGTSVFAAAVRELPIGFPKVLVTTMASGNTGPIIGARDLILIPAVVDVSGLNRISRRIIANAAGAICGMVEGAPVESAADRPIIAATMLGNTTPAVDSARRVFEQAGYEVLVFHAIGSGGRVMENLIAGGLVQGVFDLTTTELASELAGTPFSAGPDRIHAAGEKGIPQVLSTGCLDFSIFGRRETVPARYRDRRLYAWNPETTLMRTTPEESAVLGRQIAERANAARGPVAVLLPLRGSSQVGAEGQPFWWPEADQALFAAIRSSLKAGIALIEMDAHINDPAFAQKAAEVLLGMLVSQESGT